MTVYLKIEGDGITVYEDVTCKEGLLEYVNRILSEVYKGVERVDVSLEIVYVTLGSLSSEKANNSIGLTLKLK